MRSPSHRLSFKSDVMPVLRDKENILGVAIDGKVVFTMDLEEYEKWVKIMAETPDAPLPQSEEQLLANFRDLCSIYLTEVEARRPRENNAATMTKIFKDLQTKMEASIAAHDVQAA